METNVKTVAETLTNEIKLKNVKFKLTGGVDCGRTWKGDGKNMLLDISKIKSLGWKPKYDAKKAIKKATKHAIAESLSN